MPILPFIIPGRFLTVRRKQAEGVQPPEPPELPTGAGVADTGPSHMESLGPLELNSVSMAPPYEETRVTESTRRAP